MDSLGGEERRVNEGDERALKFMLRSYKLIIRDVTLHSLVKIAAKRLGHPHF